MNLTMSLVVGLTGNIACGKSSVGEILRGEGVPVLDSDEVVHDLYAHDKEVQKKLLAKFGTLDRKEISKQVFGDDPLIVGKRKELEAIIHPAVAREFKKWVDANRNEPVLVNLVPLLFEANLQDRYDYVICVVSEEEDQIERIRNRNPGLSEEEILDRIHSQMPQELKAKLSHTVILNMNSLEDLKIAVLELLADLKSIKSI